MLRERTKMIKLSVHATLRGKPAAGSNINLGYGWTNIQATWPDIFKLITEDGVATSAELSNNNRRESNFVSRQLLMVDNDSGMTIPELLEHEFYNRYAAGFYATPSFTIEKHRFRICFLLEQAETDANRLRKINRGLLSVFETADAACKDPTRLFYGTPNCEYYERLDQYLTNDMVESLIDLVDEQDQQQAVNMLQHSDLPPPVLDDAQRERILQLLRNTFVGNYPIWRNVGWGLRAGGFSLTDFQYVTAGMMNQKTPVDAMRVWSSGREQPGGVTMGSVIYLLKQHHGQDCLKTTHNQKKIDELCATTRKITQKWIKE